ncbi:hypothetical protein BZG35_04055 [Brevundimonas sp. LM2]|uniref:hypothetical protein n=1 Tax=Brevundimonas sp. LM2 TaxID=1938605 RepID=UPI000983BF06|nr:hypothetical protein [Brevundimonas sp. LM2]AQR60916.1 hypothetical protein BZG35_04055 [Brevundimonas sp. LM2]
MTVSVRTIEEDDHEALNALHRSVGWPQRSPAGWRWLWDNPARLEAGAPAGWLLVDDDDGAPCGMTGNFVQRFHRGTTVLHGASAFSVIVRPRARGQSRRLLDRFADQAALFARYVLNANSASSPIYGRHGMAAWPPRTHALKLSWRVDTLACARGRVLRQVHGLTPALIDAARERLMNDRLVDPTRLSLPPGVAVVSDLGDRSRFGDFWTALKAEGRLIADRSPATLRWRLSDPDLTLRPVLLAFNAGKAITGFAMAMVAKGNAIEPPVLEILDLIALEDDQRAIPALMEALMTNARALGAAKVRIQMVNDDLVRRLGPLAASARREGGWGHGHARFEPGTTGLETWAPTPFDGDYGLCLRPVPTPACAARRAA